MALAERAAKVHAADCILREHNPEVRRHAGSLEVTTRRDRGVADNRPDASWEAARPDVATPGESSERLLAALFGAWPRKA